METLTEKRLEHITQSSGSVMVDPLLFIRDTAKSLGIDLSNPERTRKKGVTTGEYPSFLELVYGQRNWNGEESKSLFLEIYFKDPSVECGYDGDPKKMPKDMFSLTRKFAFSRAFQDGLSFFEDYQKYVGVWFHYDRFRLAGDGFKDESQVEFDIVPDFSLNGAFQLKKPEFIYRCSEDKGKDKIVHKDDIMESAFRDVVAFSNTDFRPYVHRALELYAGLVKAPREKWHDPSIYSNDQDKLEKIIDVSIPILFSGEELGQIERQIEEARLRMRNMYVSVPRLSLGNIVLPNPGQKDISQDDFVMQGAPLLVEYLSSLGIMPAVKAEEVVTRRLENYFVHRTGFQLSRERAIAIIDSLKK
jgi:hypothetical protein